MITLRKLPLNFWECLIYGLLSAVIVFLLTKGGVTVSPDSLYYLSIAEIINTGKLTDSFIATWPPFFPMLIALINSFGFEAEESARIISVILYPTLVMVMFLLARAMAGRLVAHLTSISMLFFAPLLFVYSFCWSETVYITLSAFSLLTLDKFYRSTDVTGKRYLVWGAIFVGLAFLTRYVGVALFLAGFLIILLKKEVKVPADKIKTLILFSVIACTPLILYLMGCLYFKGRLPGYGHHVMPSLWENAISFFTTIYHDFLTFELHFASPHVIPYMVSWRPNISIHVLGNIAGIIFLILLMSYFVLKLFKGTIRNQIAPIAYVTCYSLFLILITTTWVPISMSTRFCSPIYPFVIVLCFSVVIGVCKSVARTRTKLPFWGASIFAVLFFWCIQVGSSVNVYMQMVPAETPMVEQGDITGDGIFDVSDLIYLSNYLYRGGPQPRPLQNANVNCDETINIGDMLYLVNYLYKAGPAPCNLADR